MEKVLKAHTHKKKPVRLLSGGESGSGTGGPHDPAAEAKPAPHGNFHYKLLIEEGIQYYYTFNVL